MIIINSSIENYWLWGLSTLFLVVSSVGFFVWSAYVGVVLVVYVGFAGYWLMTAISPYLSIVWGETYAFLVEVFVLTGHRWYLMPLVLPLIFLVYVCRAISWFIEYWRRHGGGW